ncbi:hypothetical protein O181_130262 [Austropuccinia psidii MF-1]|uniref:Uncharacterized protein n=1 Tax=Austropuccinia psidii MF-1 TaxID=1389203 RepID=A0A9Q3L0U3_9BASI|nr:hypothetical protein [Austropuccinia psidii MF-1]
MASTAHDPYFLDLKLCTAGHGPWSVGLSGPFWPKYNEANHQPPRRGVGPHTQHSPNLPKGPQAPHSGHFQPLASGNHQRPPAQVQKALPSIQGKDSP